MGNDRAHQLGNTASNSYSDLVWLLAFRAAPGENSGKAGKEFSWHRVCWVPSWQTQYWCLLGQLSGAGRSHCISRRVPAGRGQGFRKTLREEAGLSVCFLHWEWTWPWTFRKHEWERKKRITDQLLPGDNCGERWGLYLFQTCTPSFPRPLPTLFFFSLFL